MKNSLAVIAGLALMGAAANADVAFNANNYTANAAITGLTASGWVEILYNGGIGGNAQSLGVFAPTEPGFFDNGGMSIPGATGTSASLTVQAWVGATTFAAATTKGSVTFNQAVASWDPNAQPPAPKSGPDLTMPAFTLGEGTTPVIPEPSTIALGMLGAAALLIRRRK
jgi:hypothetical protein